MRPVELDISPKFSKRNDFFTQSSDAPQIRIVTTKQFCMQWYVCVRQIGEGASFIKRTFFAHCAGFATVDYAQPKFRPCVSSGFIPLFAFCERPNLLGIGMPTWSRGRLCAYISRDPQPPWAPNTLAGPCIR